MMANLSRIENVRRSGQYLPHDLTLDTVGLDRKQMVHGWCSITSDLEPRSLADATRLAPGSPSDDTNTEWPSQTESETSTSTVDAESETDYDPALLDLNT